MIWPGGVTCARIVSIKIVSSNFNVPHEIWAVLWQGWVELHRVFILGGTRIVRLQGKRVPELVAAPYGVVTKGNI
jgi:hypothetical protein